MRKSVVGAAALIVAAAVVSVAAPAAAEEWKTPQVIGSAPVKEEPKSNEVRAPRAVDQNPYGPQRGAGAAVSAGK